VCASQDVQRTHETDKEDEVVHKTIRQEPLALHTLRRKEMNKELLDRVLEQIAKDVESGDMTAIEELIADIPNDKAMHFLPEGETE